MSIWSRPDPARTRGMDSRLLRQEALAARARKRAAEHRHGPGPTGHRPSTRPEEHYHVIYHVPAENLAIPYFKEVFPTVREAYVKIAEMGKAAEPHTEWYEDGEVGFETQMPGRLGLYWIVVEVTGCIRRSCSQFMTRDMVKRKLTVIPENEDVVPSEEHPEVVRELLDGQ